MPCMSYSAQDSIYLTLTMQTLTHSLICVNNLTSQNSAFLSLQKTVKRHTKQHLSKVVLGREGLFPTTRYLAGIWMTGLTF